MLTKKVACGQCGWQGYKQLDGKRLQHQIVCPTCKVQMNLNLDQEEVAWTLAAQKSFQTPPLPVQQKVLSLV